MRTLPEKPSLGYLRQEAKDLLVAIRDSQPGATLAEAQRSLAEQYGFRTWTDLKAEVERRREKAEAADPELAAALAAAFGLGKVTSPMVPVAREVMGRIWSLETDTGRWSLKTVFDWIDLDQAENAVRLLESAAAAGVLAPKPVRSSSGRLLEEVAGQKWRADEWMDFGPSPTKPVHPSIASRVGGILATLHSLGLKSSAGINPWLTYRRSSEEWDQLLLKARSAGVDWARTLAETMPTILDLGTISVEAPQEPTVLSHCDLIPGNVRIGQADSLVVLHWEFAGACPPSWELGYVLIQWVSGPGSQVNAAAGRALVDAYRSASGSIPKVDISMFSSAISAVLNYTAGLIEGALDDDDPEQQQYALSHLPSLLSDPVSRAQLERMLEAIE